MNPELLLGIDVGTTMTKAAVVTADGEEVAWGRVPTPWRALPSGGEVEPMDLLDGVLRAVATALEAAPDGPVVGLGVTSIAETVVFLGKDGSPVMPSIAWHDTRGEDEAIELATTFGGPAFSERTGLVASPMCTLVKLAWLSRRHARSAERALSVADWVVYALGGDQVAEASLASRTGALSLASRSWWTEGLEWARAPAGLFPTIVQAGVPLGRVTAEVRQRLPGPAAQGLGTLERLRGAALTSAGHDHLCVAAGADAIRPAQILDSCGTAEGFVRTVAPLDGAEVRQVVSAGLNAGWHTVPDSYALIRGHALGLLLDQVLHLLGVTGLDGLAELDRVAAGVEPGSLRVVEEGPYADVSIVGLSTDASPAALWSAALACVSAEAPETVQAMASLAGPAEELVLTGGWSNCTGLRQRRRELLPRRRWSAVTEAGARGAALFGGCAAGLFSGPAAFPLPADQPWAPPPLSSEDLPRSSSP